MRYKPVRDEFYLLGNTVLRGTRLVVPLKLRQCVLELGHEGHLGIVQMKQRLRTKVWWPGIDNEAEKYSKTCHGCQVVNGSTNPEPMQRTALPQGPWQDIAIDYLGPLPSGHYVFAAVDYYSRYVEIDIIKKNTAEAAIESLDRIFTIHGLPYTVTSDNGTHFTANEFEEYLKRCGIKHRRITPLWPQANGEIERQNRSMLKRMKIAQIERQDWKKTVRTYLFAYHNTPHSTTGVSPAELLFGRKLRTKLPDLRESNVLDEEMRDRDHERKDQGKEYADNRRGAKECEFTVGDKVLLKQGKGNKLTPAFECDPYKVIEKCGNSVTIQSPEGVQYQRNLSHLKPHNERKPETASGSQGQSKDQQTSEVVVQESSGNKQTTQIGVQGSVERDEVSTTQSLKKPTASPTVRPSRQRNLPGHLKDFKLY